MQGTEDKDYRNAVRIELDQDAWQTSVLTTTPQTRRGQIVKMYLNRVNEKKMKVLFVKNACRPPSAVLL